MRDEDDRDLPASRGPGMEDGGGRGAQRHHTQEHNEPQKTLIKEETITNGIAPKYIYTSYQYSSPQNIHVSNCDRPYHPKYHYPFFLSHRDTEIHHGQEYKCTQGAMPVTSATTFKQSKLGNSGTTFGPSTPTTIHSGWLPYQVHRPQTDKSRHGSVWKCCNEKEREADEEGSVYVEKEFNYTLQGCREWICAPWN